MGSQTIPVALTIAGSDSGGGAGIQADIKTLSSLGVFGCSVISSLTAQNTLGVQGVWPVPAEFVVQQIHSVLSDMPVAAIKIGMLANAEIVAAVAKSLCAHPALPIVLDPVMVATSGDRLLTTGAMATLIDQLIPLAALITPNLHEAAALLDDPVATGLDDMRRQGEKLLRLGARAVLIKGGHGDGNTSDDLLVTPDGATVYSAVRIATNNTHGTGCTLASAITAGLAKQLSLVDSVQRAKDYLQGALSHASQLQVGQGVGPVHHFYQFY